jgi:predicted nucleic acid-binding protein
VRWLEETIEDDLFISVLTLGEIKKGIERLADGRRKQRIVHDFGLLRSRFSARVLAVTDVVAERWGEISADAERAGRRLHVVDGLIAATALVFGHTVVTRNVADFDVTPVPLLAPWS